MRRVLVIACSALLASCAHQGGLPATPNPNQGVNAITQYEQPLADNGYKLLYSFQSGEDGAYPYAGLTAFDGELYGTTYGGGGGYEWGTVFKITPGGKETVLHKFQAGNDGAHPYAGLTELRGNFFGTTYQGGKSGAGTVFKITPSRKESVIYSFKGGSDGQYPYGRLVAFNGELYGTTYQGGVYPGWGVVFKVSPSGKEHVLYRFQANNDGAHPYAGLANVNGTLYGTTYQGGTSGAGTVFKITTSGEEHVIYSFKGGDDGQFPYARLLYYNGELYGTTYQGGIYPGWGVVFKVSPSGKERVLYKFKASNDGAHPYYAGLIEIKGYLYGTTYQGGASGAGTVFSVGATSGHERVLYSFKGGSDGQYPYDGLTDLAGVLYGTTNIGGAQSAGTVFKISP
jgi:uncharacterized repeat protein (TIGR03803 family)